MVYNRPPAPGVSQDEPQSHLLRSITLSRDQKFFDMYSLVIGVLVIVTIGILVLAFEMSERTQQVFTRETAEYQAAVIERIRPVGEVYLPGEEQASTAPKVETVAEPEF